MIDIKNADKAEVLCALYNKARPMGMGFLRAQSGDLSLEEARKYINREAIVPDYGIDRGLYFDYLHGRCLKVDLSKDELDPRLYDRDYGQGAAARALKYVAGVVCEP